MSQSLKIIRGIVFSLVVAASGLQAAVTFESSSTAILSTDGTGITIDQPESTEEGDLLIAVIATDKNNAISPPVGWTEIRQQSNGATVGVWWKIASSSEPATYTFMWSNSEQAVGGILRYSGADPNDPINVSEFDNARSNQPTAPEDTTTADDVLILRLFGADNDALPSPDSSVTYPSGSEGRFALVSNSGTGSVTGAVADHLQSVPGPTTEAVFTLTSDQKWIAGTIAIKPPPLVGFTNPTPSGSESQDAALEVTLTDPSGVDVTVDYEVTGGTATGYGTDYTLLGTGMLTFLPGSVSETIDLAIVNDDRRENNETIEVRLRSSVNANLTADTVHTYTIIDDDPYPTIQFSDTTSSGNESITPANLQLELSAASDFNASVDYAVSGGTAFGGGVDYTLMAGTATITAGATTTLIPITIIDDALDEADETITVTISSPDSAIIDTNLVHTYTISDNDPSPTIEFTLPSSEDDENVTSVALQLELSDASGRDSVSVDYAVSGGTASGGGEDYMLAAGTATIMAGDTTTAISLSINNDALDEENETVIVTLSNPTNASLGAQQSHTLTINDDDAPPTVQFSIVPLSSGEGNPPAEIQIELSAPSGRDVAVNYFATDGTAQGDGEDYTLTAGTATISASATTTTIPVTIVDDSIDEPAETFLITLSDPINATLGADSVNTYTINDNDSRPTVQFTLTTSAGDEGSSPANLQLQLSSESGFDVTVNYAATGGTATGGGVDYTLTAGTATISAGATTTNIPVTIVNDNLDEFNETIEVTISSPVNADLGANTEHVRTINDNDLPPAVQFELTSSSGNESSSPANLALELVAVSGLAVTVDYAVTGGTATGGGEDYTLAADSVTISAGDMTAYIPITIIDESLFEANETIQVTISNPRNATLGANSIHTYTINNDDGPPSIQFTLASSNGNESTTSVELEIKISAVSGLDASVDFAVTGGSATGGGVDYTLASGTATVSAGDLTTAIQVSINNDALDEPDETIQVSISLPVNATLGFRTSHTYTILDDDPAPEVQFTYATSSGDESITTVNLQVDISTLSGRDVSVEYDVTGGTATSGGVDYSFTPGTAIITAGNLTTNVPITVIDDAISEPEETIVVSLSNPLNATLGSPNVHTYTIGDNETMPIVQFASDSSSGGEHVTLVNLQVALSFIADDDVSVSYTITGGSASGGGVDYTLDGDTATIPAGATSTNIPVTINNDSVDEDDETIVVTISNPVNASLGANQTHTYTIGDNDPSPSIQFAATGSSEAESVSPANLLVELSAASGREVTIDYTVSGGTATGGGEDYTLPAGTATIDAGVTSVNIPVTIVNDALNEADETIIVALSNPINANLGTKQTHTYTILDNDPLPSVQFTFASSSGSEVNTAVNLQLKLSAASGRDVTVDYSVTGGSATGNGVDYTLAAGTAIIDSGATTGSIPVTIVDDGEFEVNETILVTLTSPEYATLGTNNVHTYTIYDNDSPPSVQFAQASSSGDEGFSPVNLQLKLSAVSGQDVTVEYAVTGGTALGSGIDYTLADGTKTIPAGDTLAFIPLTILDDLLDELDETVQVSISNPVNAGLGTIQTHIYTIEDNDFPPIVEFAAAISSGDESDTPAEIEVALSTPSGLTITVDYDVTGGSATGNGTDYVLLGSGTLSFSPGAISKNISLSIIDDDVYEGEGDRNYETIELTLSDPSNATLETWGINVHTYKIIENDTPPTVQFVTASSSGDEFITGVNLQLQLSGITPFDVTVDYYVTGGSATGDSVDYALAAGTATIDSGATTGTIPITIVNDTLYEANETIEVTIFNAMYAVLGTNTVHTYNISDNDVIPVISFQSVDGSGSESLTPAALRFELSTVSGLDASIDYAVSGGTANSAGVDYTLAAGTATIPAGATSDSVLFNIVNDLNDEYNETIQVTISNPINATLGAITAYTYTIVDDDDPPFVQFTIPTSSGDESISPAQLQIRLSNASGLDVSVYYQVTGGTVLGSSTDFILPAGTATISAGELTTDIEMVVIDDDIGEFAEDVEVTISNPVNASLGSNTIHTYTILDNEEIPLLGFPEILVSLDEGYADSSVYIEMDGRWDLDVKISYDMRELTATAYGHDFTLCDSLQATIYAGDTTTVLPIDIHEDALYEEDEQFEVVLTGATYVNLGPDSVFTYTIEDNDPKPTVEFMTSSSSGPESANAGIQIELSAVSGRETQVSYSIGGTATTADYAAPSGNVSIPAGQTEPVIGIIVVNDGLDEENETIELTLTGAVNATLGTGTVHTYTINDDDNPPTVEVVAINNAHEGDTLGYIPVSLSTPSGREVTVDYSVTGGTAADTDYVSLEGTLTIPAGSWGEDIVFEMVDDTTYEADETIEVTIADPVNALLGNSIHTFTINDDDAETQVYFTLSSSSVLEDSAGVKLRVVLLAASGDIVEVDYKALDGTATNGGVNADFNLTPGTATIPAGQLYYDIYVDLDDDAVYEGNESFTVLLYSPSGANIGENTSHTVTILEDESPPLLTFDSPNSIDNESVLDPTFNVTVTTPTDLDISFEYAVTGGTAIPDGVDFTLASGSMIIVGGQEPPVTATITTASIVQDNMDEDDEYFIISLFNVINASLGEDSTHKYTIVDDDDLPTIQFNGISGGASEQTGDVTLTVTSALSGRDVSVNYTLGGEALGDSVDYQLAAGPITIPAGQTTANLALKIIDDDLYELDENIVLTLTGPTNATLGNNEIYTYEITDNDLIPTVGFTTVSSADSENVTVANLEVSLDHVAGVDVSITYAVTGGTATGAGGYTDYALSTGTDTIYAGEAATVIPVTIYDDPWDELAEETIIVTISSPVNATLGAQKVHTYTILDDDKTPTVSFASAGFAAFESASVDTVKLLLSAASRLPVSAPYIVSGSATGSGVDYSIGNSRTAQFAAGDTVVQFTTTIIDDPFAEPDETIIVTLNPDGLTNCVLGTYSAYTDTILNNDDPPSSFQLGAIAATGGLVVPGYWNSTNTSLNVKVPVENTLSLENGSIQLQARVGLAKYEDVGDSVKILPSDIDTVKNVSLSAVDFEGISGFADGVEVTVKAVISDVVGNSTVSEDSVIIVVDQTPPTVYRLGDVVTLGVPSVPGYWNMSNTGVVANARLSPDDASLMGGQVQLQAGANGTFANLGGAALVDESDLADSVISISVNAVEDGQVVGVEELGGGISEDERLAFRAMMRDVAGNTRTGNPSNRQLLVDQTAPEATVTYSRELAKYGDVVTITAAFDEELTSAPSIHVNYAGDSVSEAMRATVEPYIWTYDAEIPEGNNGEVTVDIDATDRAGNALDAINSVGELIIDNTAPSYSLAYSDSVARQGTQVIITATFQDTIQADPFISIDFPATGYNILNRTMDPTLNELVWTCIFITPYTPDGYAVVTIAAADRAGNPAEPLPGTASLRIDNTSPAIAITEPEPSAFIRQAALTYQLNENIKSGVVSWIWETTSNVRDNELQHDVTLTEEELTVGTHAWPLADPPSLVHGAYYTVRVSGSDNAGNMGSAQVSGLIYDVQAPDIGSVYVYDGPGMDIDTTRSTDSLSASYGGFDEPLSGIALYEYAVGTTPGGCDVVDWTGNGTNTTISVDSLELSYKVVYYISIRATDGAGNVSVPVSSDGVAVMDLPHLATSIVQNSLLSAYAQIFVVDSLGMVDSVHILVDEQNLELTEISTDSYSYVANHKFSSIGSHSLSVTGFSDLGDTTVTYNFGLALAKSNQSWSATSPEGQFRVTGAPGAVNQDFYLLVVDSTLMVPDVRKGGAYRLGDGQYLFEKPVKVSMLAADDKTDDYEPQAVYILRSDGHWEELPSVDDEQCITAWTESAGIFRLGRRTIIVPQTTSLHQNYPNPFNPTTRIVFDIGFIDGPDQRARVIIYNLLGQHVRTLYDDQAWIGSHELVWSGLDQRGLAVASGVYFARLTTDTGYRATIKMLLVR